MARWLLASLLLFPIPAWAHGGGLDANGLHHDRKTGGHHCPRALGASASARESEILSALPRATRSNSRDVIDRCGGKYTAVPAYGCLVVHTVDRPGPPLQPRAQAFMASPQRVTARSAGSYANCSKARAVGAAPVHAGDPGYSRRLGRDEDRVGCE